MTMPIEQAAQQASNDPYAGDETPVGTRDFPDARHPDNVKSYANPNAARLGMGITQYQNNKDAPLSELPFDIDSLLSAQDAYIAGLTAFVHDHDRDVLCGVQETFIDAQRAVLKQLGIL